MIKIDNVHKYFEDLHVLKGVDLEVKRGEVISIIGPSGSGKSTLLRCINRLEEVSDGAIWIKDSDISHATTDLDQLRTNLGFVFQNFNLFDHLSVLSNIMLAPLKVLGLTHEDAEEQAKALLEKVGLADKADNFPEQLSGGQKQRVAIARALAMNPEIMLFDEPTSALDPEMIKEVLDVIKAVSSDSDMTVIIVTHEMGFAKEVSNQIVFMDEGRILEKASPEIFFSKPENSRAQEFLAKIL